MGKEPIGMHTINGNRAKLKYLSPDNLYEQIRHFTKGMSVTKGSFELLVDRCTVDDFEWNHMDQLHRPTVHKTYDKGIRIAYGADFAISLTQWGKWPIFITVSDAYVAKGLFYQSLTLGGVIFLHCIISLEQIGDSVKLKDEWFIASHKLFRFLHKPLSKKLYKLNKRLQEEDAQIRNGRFELRKQGYQFRSDPANYYTSNLLLTNTIYPKLADDAFVLLSTFTETVTEVRIGGLNFLLQKSGDHYLLWPAVCPHEGGPLGQGKFCGTQVACPWHSLRFSAVELSVKHTSAARYGFEYLLAEDKIYIKQNSMVPFKSCEVMEEKLA